MFYIIDQDAPKTHVTQAMQGLLTATEVAAMLRVGPQRVRHLARLGHLPGAVRTGPRQWRFNVEAVQKWISTGGHQEE